MITERQVEQYNSDGYIVVENVIDVEMLNELQRVTDDLVEKARGITEHTSTLDLDPSHTADRPLVRRIKHPYFAHPFYETLAAYPPIMAVLSELIGGDIRLRTGGKVNLNGPLLVLPGSHKGPIYNHHSQGVFCGAIDVKHERLDVSGARELHGAAGAITVHHARLVHGSAVNRSSRARQILFYVYASCDAWPLMGVSDLEEFDSMIMHGNPTLNPRMEEVPVRMPLPVAANQGSIYENQRALENRYFLA